MTNAIDDIVHFIASPGERGLAVSRVLCALIVQGGTLGELEEREAIDHDGPRLIKVPPAQWFERLRNALDRGAFERMAEQDIVARILTPMERAA